MAKGRPDAYEKYAMYARDIREYAMHARDIREIRNTCT